MRVAQRRRGSGKNVRVRCRRLGCPFRGLLPGFFQSPSPELNWSTLMCKLPRRKNNYPGMHRWDAKHLPNVYFSPPRCLQTLSITSQTLALVQTLQVTLWIKNTYNPYPGPPGHGNRLGACGPLPHSPGAPRPGQPLATCLYPVSSYLSKWIKPGAK